MKVKSENITSASRPGCTECDEWPCHRLGSPPAPELSRKRSPTFSHPRQLQNKKKWKWAQFSFWPLSSFIWKFIDPLLIKFVCPALTFVYPPPIFLLPRHLVTYQTSPNHHSLGPMQWPNWPVESCARNWKGMRGRNAKKCESFKDSYTGFFSLVPPFKVQSTKS